MPDPLLSDNLLTYRLRCSLTLKELSERTGLSPATLHRIENGICRATNRSRVKLADGLGLSQENLDHLLQGKWESHQDG